MNKYLFGLIVSLITLSAYAAPEAEVIVLRGSATYAGKPIQVKDTLKGQGEIQVADKSYLRIRFKEGNHTVSFAGNSAGKLNFDNPGEKDSIGLLKGYARWVTGSKSTSPQSGIRTKNAVMGIRGTDFMSLYNSDLGETEIWVFDGLVEFTNGKNKADYKRVAKNQWGGIGGRFGTKCQEILTLEPELIKKIGAILPIE